MLVVGLDELPVDVPVPELVVGLVGAVVVVGFNEVPVDAVPVEVKPVLFDVIGVVLGFVPVL